MQEADFIKAVEAICEKDQRYDPDAYFFTKDALFFTARMLEKPAEGPGRHITGRELLEGIRNYTLQEFGPMSLTVLKTWGIMKTEDFGEIVFNLVESGQLGKTDKDRREDFANGYDFQAAFSKPFQPAIPLPTTPPQQRVKKRVSRKKPGSEEK
jgi:uncharacterized repeat protein (TIGR04138 family)